jgi:hypothetical protein
VPRPRQNAAPASPKAPQPVQLKTPPLLYQQTQPILAKVSERIGMPLLTYWNSTNGAVCHNDVVGMHEVLRRIGQCKELAIFVKSDGGTGTASLRIVNLLRGKAKRLTALLPLNCESAATMIAIGADEIQMGPMAFLSAVDTSLRHELSPINSDNRRVSVSHDELLRVIRLSRGAATGEEAGSDAGDGAAYRHLFPHIHPLVIGAVDRASSLSEKLCTEILGFHIADRAKAARISQTLNSEYPSHSYPIILSEARRIGLNASALPDDVNDLLLDLNGLYSEMGQAALTDRDERNYHSNEILNIIECQGLQVYYQEDKDWHYRLEERKWVPLNDNSSWRAVRFDGKKTAVSQLHIR